MFVIPLHRLFLIAIFASSLTACATWTARDRSPTANAKGPSEDAVSASDSEGGKREITDEADKSAILKPAPLIQSENLETPIMPAVPTVTDAPEANKVAEPAHQASVPSPSESSPAAPPVAVTPAAPVAPGAPTASVIAVLPPPTDFSAMIDLPVKCGADADDTEDPDVAEDAQMSPTQRQVLLATVAAVPARQIYFDHVYQEAQLNFCPAPLSNAHDAQYNSSGETFLHTHSLIWNHLQQALTKAKLNCYQGWSRLPILTGKVDPAVAGQLINWESILADDDWLSSHSLSQLGWALEFGIYHNALAIYPSAGPTDAAFWQLHGYVEHVLQAWLDAHDKTRISEKCGISAECYTWSQKKPEQRTTAAEVTEPAEVIVTRFLALGRLRPADIQAGTSEAESGKLSGKSHRAISSEDRLDDPFEFAKMKVCSGDAE